MFWMKMLYAKRKKVSRTWFHYCVFSSKGNKPTLPKTACY